MSKNTNDDFIFAGRDQNGRPKANATVDIQKDLALLEESLRVLTRDNTSQTSALQQDIKNVLGQGIDALSGVPDFIRNKLNRDSTQSNPGNSRVSDKVSDRVVDRANEKAPSYSQEAVQNFQDNLNSTVDSTAIKTGHFKPQVVQNAQSSENNSPAGAEKSISQIIEETGLNEEDVKNYQGILSSPSSNSYDKLVAKSKLNPKPNLYKRTPDLTKKIRELPDNVKSKIFGQDKAVDEVIDVLKTGIMGLSTNKNKPKVAAIFAGPSGCGKTETVIQVASYLGIPIKKINMAEFSEENDVKKLVGSPPGYVGYEEGGQLTNFAMENPCSIVLLDEIEKAHESLSKILLGVLDDGTLTDNHGLEVKFKNVLFIATTNLGAEIEYVTSMSEEDKNEYRMQAIKGFFRPEVLNRMDSILQFKAIDKEVYGKIVNKNLNSLVDSFKQEHDITFSVSDVIHKFIVNESYDPAMGGRPAGRFITKVLIKGIVDKMFEENTLDEVKEIVLDLNDKGNIIFKKPDGEIITEVTQTADLLKTYKESKMTKDEQATKDKAQDLAAKGEAKIAPNDSTNPSNQQDVVSQLNQLIGQDLSHSNEQQASIDIFKQAKVKAPVAGEEMTKTQIELSLAAKDPAVAQIAAKRVKARVGPKRG